MTTLTISDAQKRLGAILERVIEGEDIGIIAGDQVIQLKPVQVVAWESSYLFQEYGLTPEEWTRFKARMQKRRSKEDYAAFTGKFDPKQIA